IMSDQRLCGNTLDIGAIPCKSIRQTHCTIQTIAIFWVSISDSKRSEVEKVPVAIRAGIAHYQFATIHP
ncbi:MAG: hypothetical protein SGI77_22985, partial [Pirellulaceae bacterium]|nr:hypothetical protein [Pirellulaceae bacterium]